VGNQSSHQRPRRQRVCPHVPFHIRTTLSRRLVGTHRFSPVLDLALSPCECKYSSPATGDGREQFRDSADSRRAHAAVKASQPRQFGPARNSHWPSACHACARPTHESHSTEFQTCRCCDPRVLHAQTTNRRATRREVCLFASIAVARTLGYLEWLVPRNPRPPIAPLSPASTAPGTTEPGHHRVRSTLPSRGH
jgi:hypothetical protein